MSDKALTRSVLELTQKIQMHFPDIDPTVAQAWNGVPAATITAQLQAAFGHNPNANQPVVEVKVPAKPKPTLLEPIGTITIPATAEKFIAKKKFVVNTSRKAKVKISFLGDNFNTWFGDKIEDPISEQILRYQKLRQVSVDGPIIAELGGVEKSETMLSEVFALMEKQGKGEDGALLTNGYWNIFYVKDANNVLRAVRVGWGGGGWRVSALSVEFPRGWLDGFRVFSRNCN